MRKFEKLDSVDRKILHEIQIDGRIAFIDLADKLSLIHI